MIPSVKVTKEDAASVSGSRTYSFRVVLKLTGEEPIPPLNPDMEGAVAGWVKTAVDTALDITSGEVYFYDHDTNYTMKCQSVEEVTPIHE